MTSRKGAGLIDTAELNRVLLSQADAVVARWLPNGKLQGPYVKFGGVDGYNPNVTELPITF